MQDINIRIFNGTLTVENPSTGGKGIYEVKTEKWYDRTTRVKRGEKRPFRRVRVIKVKEGLVFKSFAMIKDDGTITLFKTCQAPVYHQHLSILTRIEHNTNRGLNYMASTCCRRCNRELTDVDSVKTGIGPYCVVEMGLKMTATRMKSLTDNERFGELRDMVRHKEMDAALIALGYMDDALMRQQGRIYMQDIYSKMHNMTVKHTAKTTADRH